MPERHDPERDRWSRRATESLFPQIARDVFGVAKQEDVIYTWNQPDIDRLDKEYGVDILLHTPRRRVALAARIRGYEYYKSFGDVTIRLDSLYTLGKMLEMQKSIARFMFYAWGDSDKPILPVRFVDWHIILLQELIDLYLKGKIKSNGPFSNGDKSSRLVGFGIQELSQHKLIYRSSGIETCSDEPEDFEQGMLFDDSVYLEALRHDMYHRQYND